jgi:hypothetical protein
MKCVFLTFLPDNECLSFLIIFYVQLHFLITIPMCSASLITQCNFLGVKNTRNLYLIIDHHSGKRFSRIR